MFLKTFKVFDEENGEGGGGNLSDASAQIDKMLGLVNTGVIDPKAVSPDDAVKDLSDSGKLSGATAAPTSESDNSEVETVEKNKEQPKAEAKISDDKKNKDESTEELSDVDLLKAQNAALIAQIESLTAGTVEEPQAQEPELQKTESKEDESKESASQQFTSQPTEPVKFVNPEEYDSQEFFESPENLNKLANDVLNKSNENAILAAVKMIHNLVPPYVQLYIESEKFFSANPELATVRGFTSQVFQEITNKNPKMSLQDRFAEAKKEVYKRLKLPDTQRVKESTPTARKPKFPQGGSGARNGSPPSGSDEDLTPTQKGINKMLEVVGI